MLSRRGRFARDFLRKAAQSSRIVTSAQLQQQLDVLIAGWEGECVEFKDANDNFSTSEIGKYFAALSNEANLRGRASAWLVFGVENKTRSVIGTSYRQQRERLDSLNH